MEEDEFQGVAFSGLDLHWHIRVRRLNILRAIFGGCGERQLVWNAVSSISRKALPILGPYNVTPVSTLCQIFWVSQRYHQFVEKLGDLAVRRSTKVAGAITTHLSIVLFMEAFF